jgi:hypothetical protein
MSDFKSALGEIGTILSDNIKNSYAVLSLACCAFFRFSLIIVEPKKSPIADSPTTKMKAGSLTAHSRAGNQL